MKGNKIIELQVGFHTNRARNYQRVITNEYFDDYRFEHQHKDNGYYITYSKQKPYIHNKKVDEVCDDMWLVLDNAKINYNAKDTPIKATIRDGRLIFDDMDIWGDIKVWINGVYSKYTGNTLFYTKHAYHSRYLRDGVIKEELITDKFWTPKGHEVSYTIETYNIQNRYALVTSGYNRLEFEVTDGIHGRYHGYNYFHNFDEVKEFFREKHGKELIQRCGVIKHHY